MSFTLHCQKHSDNQGMSLRSMGSIISCLDIVFRSNSKDLSTSWHGGCLTNPGANLHSTWTNINCTSIKSDLQILSYCHITFRYLIYGMIHPHAFVPHTNRHNGFQVFNLLVLRSLRSPYKAKSSKIIMGKRVKPHIHLNLPCVIKLLSDILQTAWPCQRTYGIKRGECSIVTKGMYPAMHPKLKHVAQQKPSHPFSCMP